MTNIEIQTLDAVKSASREITRHIEGLHNTDKKWEQRRYEIAKDVLANLVGAQWNMNEDTHVAKAVRLADKLIEELRKPTE
ncbi:MAG: hypothetical protein KBT34_03175 [Prevotella sp.]|nr:hypothetical protein [Candidatus Prevotella equi]